MPRGLALGSLSGSNGMPVELEKRTDTGVEGEATCGALVSVAASGAGVKVPESRMPLAWAGRKPGCRPNNSSNCLIRFSLSAISFSSVGRGISQNYIANRYPVLNETRDRTTRIRSEPFGFAAGSDTSYAQAEARDCHRCRTVRNGGRAGIAERGLRRYDP